jgi:transposase InsO family protein
MRINPWTIFLVGIAGWMNRRQQDVIAYLREENRILREKLDGKRVLLSDEQKCRLAAKAKALGRELLEQFGTLFSPDTLLKWHRLLIARKYDGSKRRRGPTPTKAKMIRDHVVRMAQENPSWGYGRIHGELKKLGYDVHWQTVRRVMLDHGLLPDPDRPYRTTWKDFLKSHWESLAATDFFSVEAWSPKGLTRYLVLFVIEVATRKVEIVGIHENPCEDQMMQWARNLTDPEDGFLKGKRVLIHDRDPLYTKKFRETLQAAGVRPLKLPKQSPDLNSVAESFVRNITRECLNRMIFFGEKHVRYVVSSYVEHYNRASYCHTSLCACTIESKLSRAWSCGLASPVSSLLNELVDGRAVKIVSVEYPGTVGQRMAERDLSAFGGQAQRLGADANQVGRLGQVHPPIGLLLFGRVTRDAVGAA